MSMQTYETMPTPIQQDIERAIDGLVLAAQIKYGIRFNFSIANGDAGARAAEALAVFISECTV